MGIDLPPAAASAFEIYYSLLEDYGQNTNLTAIKGAEDVARKHFLDSIALLNDADFSGKWVIDIGSGAGFPGVPLKLVYPETKMTFLDSNNKRVTFLRALCDTLNIDAEIIHARAEEISKTPQFRDTFDIAVSRAVAELRVLCELCLPYVKAGGLFISMKGVKSIDEIDSARNAIKQLGAELVGSRVYRIPGTDIEHRSVVIRKTADTPAGYPRRLNKIINQPL